LDLVLDSIDTTRFAQARTACRLRSLAFVLEGLHLATPARARLVPEVLKALYAVPPAPSSGRNESALRIELILRHAGQCDKKQFRRLFVKLVKTNVLAESVKVMSSQTLATLLSDAGIKHGGLAKPDVLQTVIAVVQARADAYASSLPKNPDEVRAFQGLCLQTGVQPGLQTPSHTTP